MVTVVTLLTVILSLVAFFYKSDGGKVEVKGVGFVILSLIVTLGSYNIFSTINKSHNEVLQKRENTRLKIENRKSQTAIQLQYLDYQQPFSSASLDFGVDTPAAYNSNLPYPYGENHFVLFPDLSKFNLEARFWFLAGGEGISRSIELAPNANGGVQIFESTANYPKNKFKKYELYPDGRCNFLRGSPCNYLGPKGANFVIERLATFSGDKFLLLDVEDIVVKPAMAEISEVMQSPYIAAFNIKSGRKKLDIAVLAQYLKNKVYANFRFFQPHKDKLQEVCNRVAILPLSIDAVKKFPPETNATCDRYDMCFLITHNYNLNVDVCQISQF